MKAKWITNDWFSTTLVLSCENCGKILYNGVYTINLTKSQKKKEAEERIRYLKIPICPNCKNKP